MDINFTNHTVLLTGGSRGIGRETATVFAENGAIVIAPTRGEMDLMNMKSIEDYFSANPNLKPDIFIHCAGINELAGISEISSELLDHVFHVNYYAPTIIMKHICQNMREQMWGRIVLVSSLYAIVSKAKRIAYSSSKNALTGLMKSSALELAPFNVLINSVAPGYVMTEMTKTNLSEQELTSILSNIPTGRLQSEREIADTIAFLCTDLNQSITGQLLAVDGGFTCQ